MDQGVLGMIIFGVVLVASVVGWRVLSVKAKLPPLPPFGPLPLQDLPKYFATTETAIAWEAVRGWNLNDAPPRLDVPGAVDQIVLTQRLLNFCSAKSGRLALAFNFLVGAVEGVEFQPSALPPGLAPPGFGLVTVHTPSGRTLFVGSPALAQAIERLARLG